MRSQLALRQTPHFHTFPFGPLDWRGNLDNESVDHPHIHEAEHLIQILIRLALCGPFGPRSRDVAPSESHYLLHWRADDVTALESVISAVGFSRLSVPNSAPLQCNSSARMTLYDTTSRSVCKISPHKTLTAGRELQTSPRTSPSTSTYTKISSTETSWQTAITGNLDVRPIHGTEVETRSNQHDTKWLPCARAPPLRQTTSDGVRCFPAAAVSSACARIVQVVSRPMMARTNRKKGLAALAFADQRFHQPLNVDIVRPSGSSTLCSRRVTSVSSHHM